MKLLYKKVLLALLIVVYGLFNAQSNGPGAPCFPGDPCDPPATPIDMYQSILGIVAIFIIVYALLKNKVQKI